ncbi:MAG: hypothetical protein DUD31_03915 [Coriobacteriaceae bacterium]|jgi:ribosomal protein S27AE|nr:MAG: hypothetical protein DUD31_03915 [Coriobacteriaceae bacterium]
MGYNLNVERKPKCLIESISMLAENESGQQLPPKAARDLATFRKSVNDEMVYQRDVGGRSYRIVNGERVRREKAASIYSFEMESELHLSEDAPITVDVDKRSSKGSVIACEAFEITLSLEEDLGEKVSLAYIHAEPWKLLEALNERLSTLNASNSPLAVQLMQQGPALATERPITAVAAGQEIAKKHVRENPITLIWGPPGTGKTYTMAEIAINHILTGRTVLAVSHSNVSVDGMVLQVAKLLRERGLDKVVNNAEVMRFGHVRDEALDAEEDLVSYRYALSCNPDLKDELDSLEKRRTDLRKTGVRTSSELVGIQERINKIRKSVNEDELRAVAHAHMVATTVSKLYANKFFTDRKYDLVLFDEVSMAYVPQIVCAAMHASRKLVLVGDFRQLAPIVSSPAKDVLSKDVFSYLGIVDREQRAHFHPWLVMLNEQRRMHPEISAFSSEAFYEGLLRDHPDVRKARSSIVALNPCAGSAMTLVDLRGTYCPSASNADHSRFNVLGAAVSFGLALTAAKSGAKSIGVIAPYIAQARLVRAMMQDYQERRTQDMTDLSETACSTVHQFQGSERDVIVLDTVESYPAMKPGILTGKNVNGSVDRLVNVAVTRARGKLFTVANENFWDTKAAGERNAFRALCRYDRDFGRVLSARNGTLADMLHSLDFGPNIALLDPSKAKDRFLADLRAAEIRVVFSFPDGKLEEPFAAEAYSIVHDLRDRGVEVFAKCSEYGELPEDWKTFTWQSDDAIFPLVMIDGKICWYGMPPSRFHPPVKNGVAPQTVLETPLRIEGFHAVDMIWSLTNLGIRRNGLETQSLIQRYGTKGPADDGAEAYGLAGCIKKHKRCPECGAPMMLSRGHKSGKFFLRCTSCEYVGYLTPEDVNHYICIAQARCPKCGASLSARLSGYGVYIKCDGAARHTVRPDEI